MKYLHAALFLFITGCATTGFSDITPTGKDTYMLARSGSFVTSSGGSVKADLYKEANAFCASKGKNMMPVSASSRDASPYKYATAEIQFRCLAENDSQYGRPEAGPEIKVQVND